MAAPTVTATLDKASYAKGDKAVLTVVYGDVDNATNTITITGTDAAGAPAVVTVALKVVDPVTLKVTDDSSRVWAKQSDSGSVAVFTTTV